MKVMKKILLALSLVAITTTTINAQTIPDRRGEGFKPKHKQEMGKRHHRMDLNLLT
jgi:nucleoside-specific outer membrane channel protein Tsx